MNETSNRLLSAANGATALLGRLNLAELPRLGALHIGQNHRDGWKTGVMAMLDGYGLSELEEIDAVRSWAVALDGVLRLNDDDFGGEHDSYRQLAAIAVLPDGSRFEVWTHLHRTPACAPDLVTV